MNNKERAAARRNFGLTRELEVVRDRHDPHPKNGGTRGYPMWYRLLCVDYCQTNGWNYAQAAGVLQPCKDTLQSWCEVRLEHYEMTGGKERTVSLEISCANSHEKTGLLKHSDTKLAKF